MISVVINRTDHQAQQTLGELSVYNDGELSYKCKTLELPWRDNKRSVSCIPAGGYEAVKYFSPSRGDCFLVKKVPGRSAILIHSGNYNRDTRGCILPGSGFADIDKDGLTDVIESKKTMKRLNDAITDDAFKLIVND